MQISLKETSTYLRLASIKLSSRGLFLPFQMPSSIWTGKNILVLLSAHRQESPKYASFRLRKIIICVVWGIKIFGDICYLSIFIVFQCDVLMFFPKSMQFNKTLQKPHTKSNLCISVVVWGRVLEGLPDIYLGIRPLLALIVTRVFGMNLAKLMFIHVLGMQRCENQNDTSRAFLIRQENSNYSHKISFFTCRIHESLLGPTVRQTKPAFQMFCFSTLSQTGENWILCNWIIHTAHFLSHIDLRYLQGDIISGINTMYCGLSKC